MEPFVPPESEAEDPDPAADAHDKDVAAWQAARDAGLSAARAGDAVAAESHWLQAVEFSEKLPAPDPRQAQSCEDLGALYSQLNRHDDAVLQFRRALAIRELSVFPADLSVGETLYQLAWSLWQSGRGLEAEPILRRALPPAESAHGNRSLRVANLLNNLALVLAESGDDDDSEQEQLLLRALSIKEELCGPASTEVAATLNNLAMLHARRGDARSATDLFARALAIRKASQPADHPDLAETYANFGRLLLEQGRPADAEPLLRAAAGIERRPDRLSDVLELIAAARRSARDYAGALEFMKRSLLLKERRLSPSHPDLAGTLSHLSGLYGASGMYEEAGRAGRRALEIRRVAFGPGSPAVVHLLQHLARIAHRQGDLSQAESLCREALVMVEHHAGAGHPTAADILEQLAGIVETRGDTRHAATFRTRAAAIREDAGEDLMDD